MGKKKHTKFCFDSGGGGDKLGICQEKWSNIKEFWINYKY